MSEQWTDERITKQWSRIKVYAIAFEDVDADSAQGLVEDLAAWLDAVEDRAARRERERVAHLIDGEMDVLTEDGQPLSSDEAAEYDALSRVRGYIQEATR